MKHAPTREIVWLFIATRLILIFITYIGYILFTAPKYSTTAVDGIALLSSWNHWDAANYVRIAQYGYQTQYDLAFFPLFPFLIFCIGHLAGSWSYLAIGTLLSNSALLGALFILYQLATDAAGEQVARRTVLYLCIFPTAFFFFAAYNESLFLFFTAGAFLGMRRQRWELVGIFGFLAALTRSPGILLVIPYLYELWLARENISASRSKMALSIVPLLLIPLGTLIYSLYCWHISGNPIAFATVQFHWGRHLSWPWQGLWQAGTTLLWFQPFGSANQAHLLLDLSATLGFITLALLGRRILRTSYTIWIAILLLYLLLDPALEKPDILLSNQRFVLEMFPGFITLAALGIRHPRLHQALLLLLPALLATLSIVFIMNRWIV